MRNTMRTSITVVILALSLVVGGCAKRQTPVATPQPAPPAAQPPQIATANPAPPRRVDEALPVPAQPAVSDDAASSRSIDDLNRNSPLKPVFFSVDSADLDETARAVASANADVLKKNSSWVITIEGHCDERGTAEYNLALGERRAIAVKTFLVSLEEAFYRNRRGHFVITSN